MSWAEWWAGFSEDQRREYDRAKSRRWRNKMRAEYNRARGLPDEHRDPPGKPSSVADPHCFSSPESCETAAYFIGLLMADGQIADKRYGTGVSLGLIEPDRPVVDALNSFLGSCYPVRIIQRKAGTAFGTTSIARIDIHCRQIYADLHRFGLHPRKSHDATFRGGVETNRHTWRGMVDGDGSTFFDRRYGAPVVSLCGTAEILSQLISYVKKIAPDYRGTVCKTHCPTLHRVSVSGGNAALLASALYANCKVALPRKHEIANRIMRWVSRRSRFTV